MIHQQPKLLQRHYNNPILTAAAWPCPANSVLNPGAVILAGGTALPLCRVEDQSVNPTMSLVMADKHRPSRGRLIRRVYNQHGRIHYLDRPGRIPMTEARTLHDAFIDELRDTYDAERQLTRALPKLARMATAPELREAFEVHLKETEGQIARLEQVFEGLDEKVRGKHCDGIAGIIEEGKSMMEENFDDTIMDACLIAAGQRAEHYEMAAYGTLVAWARTMGHSEAATLLQETLDEEKAADKKLSGLAEGGINQGAADTVDSDGEEETATSARRAKKTTASKAKPAARR